MTEDQTNAHFDGFQACAARRRGESGSFDSVLSQATSVAAMSIDEGLPTPCHGGLDCMVEVPMNPPQGTGGLHDAPSRAASAPSQIRPWRVGAIYPIIPGRLSYVVHRDEEQTREHIDAFPRKYFFSADFQERYEPFCMDFGPVNLGVVHQFCTFMRRYWKCCALKERELVYYSEEAVDTRTNAAFLMAAYLMLDHDMTPERAWAPFAIVRGDAFATYRDATFLDQSYDLPILECLRGLSRAVRLGWYNPKTFDLAEYEHLDHPGNADMHMCCPNVAAFKGPSAELEHVAPGVVTFPPDHFVGVFRDKGITAVVRLNEADTYPAEAFTNAGLSHYDLYFDDCTVPSNAITVKFLEIAEREEGIAVHCRAGLGRTGVLIAAHLIKNFGFRAAEAIGWLRIVRPGSVIGQQQQYLHFIERVFASSRGSAPEPAPFADLPAQLTAEQAQALGDQIARAQAVRAETLASAERAPPTAHVMG